MAKFPYYQQLDNMDCGPTCLRMIAKYHGRAYSLQTLREKTSLNRNGVSLYSISEAAETIGLRTVIVKIPFEKFAREAPMPCVVHWKEGHFIVVYEVKLKVSWASKISEMFNDSKLSSEHNASNHTDHVSGRNVVSRFSKIDATVFVADPAAGYTKYSAEEFCKGWYYSTENGESKGVALLADPTISFYEGENEAEKFYGFNKIRTYLLKYKPLIYQLLLGLIIGSGLQFLFPFLTQAVVDIGINTRNTSFLTIILVGQFMLLFSRLSIEFTRSWLLLNLSTRLNLSILSDFLIKLMKLPISFFDAKQFGDLMQRINDHRRIEDFLTSKTIMVIFSILNLFIFSIILAFYDFLIFSIFIAGGFLYVAWIALFLKARRSLDSMQFEASAKSQGLLIQLIQGMQEIKLANAERPLRWAWEQLQIALFRIQVKNLSLNQYQQGGAFALNESKNILIMFISAKAVIDGNLTLGGMLAIQFIIGQLNSPLDQLVGFVQDFQSAKISLERMNDIHSLKDEEPSTSHLSSDFGRAGNLIIKNLSFKYPGSGSDLVLHNIGIQIPSGKTTAIVGMSGSGKTTLLKLLLKFYEPTSGEIFLDNISLANCSHSKWRSYCGVVMQDGYIFSDSIARNIAVGSDHIDIQRLNHAINVANLNEFIQDLPSGFNTKIGDEGTGISQGQRQRILIARVIYKDPEYILFDEATNALDANNEAVIMKNLNVFFEGKTVVVVAHRLSTVTNADQILVLEKGRICEAGTHSLLVERKGVYWNLVKNQLELGT